VENLAVVANRGEGGLKYDYAKISYLNIRILLIGGFPPVGVEDIKLVEHFSYAKLSIHFHEYKKANTAEICVSRIFQIAPK
jgi:hypothetical protein